MFSPLDILLKLSTPNFFQKQEKKKKCDHNTQILQQKGPKNPPGGIRTYSAPKHIKPVARRSWLRTTVESWWKSSVQKLNEQKRPHPSRTLLEKGMLSRKAQLGSKSLHSSARKFTWLTEKKSASCCLYYPLTEQVFYINDCF